MNDRFLQEPHHVKFTPKAYANNFRESPASPTPLFCASACPSHHPVE